MILLSALLASLTGLVAGERPAERARVELSAATQAVASNAVAMRRTDRAVAVAPSPRMNLRAPQALTTEASMPVLGVRKRLSLKQSWLE